MAKTKRSTAKALSTRRARKILRRRRQTGLLGFLYNNGLSIAFMGLFLVCLIAQSWVGLWFYNDQQKVIGAVQLNYWDYVLTGEFLDAVLVNWQAAFLQLFSLIVLSGFLLQRGATQSRKLGSSRLQHMRYSLRAWLSHHSMSLVFLALFIGTFIMHLLAGTAAHNEQIGISREAQLNCWQFLQTAEFWFLTFSVWQAAYFAIGVYLILSIFTREDNSPEAKPYQASNDVTGEVND